MLLSGARAGGANMFALLCGGGVMCLSWTGVDRLLWCYGPEDGVGMSLIGGGVGTFLAEECSDGVRGFCN